MSHIRATDVLADILAIHNTEIGGIPRTAILNTFAANTGFAFLTNITARTAVLTIRLKIRRLNAVDARCRHTAAIRITAVAGILTDTILTNIRRSIHHGIIRTRIVTGATMRCI